jgi:hypothetical protein
MDPLARRVADRYAKEVELNLEWVESLRKDFLILMKNFPRIKTDKEFEQVREAIKVFRNNFDSLFFDNFLNREFKYDRDISEGDRKWYDEKLRTSGWSFYIELSIPSRFEENGARWINRLKDKARDFWKDLKDFVEWYSRVHQKPGYNLKVRDSEKIEMSGFKVTVVGFDPHYEDQLERFKAGLHHFRQRAQKVLPMMLQYMLPIQLNGYATLDEGGTYERDHIEIALTGFSDFKNPNIVAHVIAHEMGHHLFKTYLSEADQKFWYAAIREDSEPLDVAKLLSMWPEGAWAHELIDKLKDVDPLMALQIDVISAGQSHSGGSNFSTREDFEKLLAGGTKFFTVKHPITGYAGKNAEEAFCETIGRLVGFGPATVHPIILHWLKIILPDVRVAKVLSPEAVLFR